MNKPYNTTQLYTDKAEERGIVHRDYLAHCLRWTHILKHAKIGMHVLDVGCGVNFPLAWMLYTNRYKPASYVGLDFRPKFDDHSFNFPVKLIGNFDATNDNHWDVKASAQLDRPIMIQEWDIVTCLEVIEHMPKQYGIRLLENLSCLNAKKIFLSTPCFNGKAAANHIYEWEYLELKNELAKYFHVTNHYGTFASQRDVIPHLSASERQVFDSLKRYYDSNLISILFAPIYPMASRNCIWQLSPK